MAKHCKRKLYSTRSKIPCQLLPTPLCPFIVFIGLSKLLSFSRSYCGTETKIAWMTPQAHQPWPHIKRGSFYKNPLIPILSSPLPLNTAAHLSLQGSHSEGTRLHWQETLPLTCSHWWAKVWLHTKLTHKCVIVVLCSSALIMHFKILPYRGSIKDIRYHRSVKCTVCFLIKWKRHAASKRKVCVWRTRQQSHSKNVN